MDAVDLLRVSCPLIGRAYGSRKQCWMFWRVSDEDLRWRRLWKIRRGRQRVGVIGTRGCCAGGGAGAAGHAASCHRSGSGLRDSSGRPCIGGKRVSRGTARCARYSGIRSHPWASWRPLHLHRVTTIRFHLAAWYRARCSPTLRCCTPGRRLCPYWQTIAAPSAGTPSRV